MSKYHSYLNSAINILNSYSGEEPFAAFLKKFFSSNKKYGSKDRKTIAHLCYCFFRMGKMNLNTELAEKIIAALFLCSSQSNGLLQALNPDLDSLAGLTVKEKLDHLDNDLSLFQVFPWRSEFSAEIEQDPFSESFYVQPDVFLRLRPGYFDVVKQELTDAGITFQTIDKTCLELEAGIKVDLVIELDKQAVVQDLNSQRTGEFFSEALQSKLPDSAWDCCAGSGGKSIMFHDLAPTVKLTVTDIRESIISNLIKRFQKAGIKNYNAAVLDVSSKRNVSGVSKFDLIICDVPCTGSGTWGRTPEQLYYFDQRKIESYSARQKQIVSNIMEHLVEGGFIIYITCSVFRKENEEIISFIQQHFPVELKRMEVLKGYDKKADTMFAALLQKS